MNFLRSIHDWRERRVAIREIKKFEQADEEDLAKSDANPLHLAELAIRSNNNMDAAVYWEDARIRMPNHILESDRSKQILLALGRFDEFEALMKKGLLKSPRSNQYMIGLAQLYEHRQDFDQAAVWWLKIHKIFRNDRHAYIFGAACLQKLNRLQEAATLLKTGTLYLPSDDAIWIELAKIKEEAQEWTSSLDVWDHVAYTMGHALGYVGGARVCEATGDFDGALKRLREGYVRHPCDADLLAASARQAERRGNLSEAAEFWKIMRLLFPSRDTSCREEVRCLLLGGRVDDANTILAEAARRFPGEFPDSA